MSTTYFATPITEHAIVVDPRDNLAVVKKETQPGLEVALAVHEDGFFAPVGFGQQACEDFGIGPGQWQLGHPGQFTIFERQREQARLRCK